MQTFRLPRIVYEDLELPGWDEMTDLDRGCALVHISKRESEGDGYAISDYPCRYRDDPLLTALPQEQACSHAVQVAGHYEDAAHRLGIAEFDRLHGLALRRRGS